jgi:hypothetical protein
MSKVVRVKDGNYKIVVDNPSGADGGTITLDTTGGYTTDRGKVVVTGDLEVKGTTTTVESSNTTIEDNIITLNKGNGAHATGIPAALGYEAGIEVDRGSYAAARLVFDETVPYVQGGSSGTGSWIFRNQYDQYLPVSFNAVNAQGDLYVTTPNGAINVAGTVDYEENVLTYTNGAIVDSGGGVIQNNDYIPNAKAMVDYVDYSFQSVQLPRIQDNDTKVETLDFDTSGNESEVKVTVDNIVSAQFFTNRAVFSDIQIIGNEISTNDYVSNKDLVIGANGTGVVKINDIIELPETPGDDDLVIDPSAPLSGLRIYAKPESNAGTGLFFINKDNTQDEIISRNRALVFSMLF